MKQQTRVVRESSKVSRIVRKKPRPKPSYMKMGLTYVMSAVLPLLAVAGTKMSGTLAAQEHWGIAGLVGFVVLCVFSVSLRHCAGAIRGVIHAPAASSWILAIALDLAVVSAEITDTLAPELGLHFTCLAVMIGIGLLSAALNYLSFAAYSK